MAKMSVILAKKSYTTILAKVRCPAGRSGFFEVRARVRPDLKIRRPVDHYQFELVGAIYSKRQFSYHL